MRKIGERIRLFEGKKCGEERKWGFIERVGGELKGNGVSQPHIDVSSF